MAKYEVEYALFRKCIIEAYIIKSSKEIKQTEAIRYGRKKYRKRIYS